MTRGGARPNSGPKKRYPIKVFGYVTAVQRKLLNRKGSVSETIRWLLDNCFLPDVGAIERAYRQTPTHVHTPERNLVSNTGWACSECYADCPSPK